MDRRIDTDRSSAGIGGADHDAARPGDQFFAEGDGGIAVRQGGFGKRRAPILAQQGFQLFIPAEHFFPFLADDERFQLTGQLLVIDTKNELPLQQRELFGEFDLEVLRRWLEDGAGLPSLLGKGIGVD